MNVETGMGTTPLATALHAGAVNLTGWSERLERKGEDDAGSGSDKCNPSLQPCVGSLVRTEAKECRGLACG